MDRRRFGELVAAIAHLQERVVARLCGEKKAEAPTACYAQLSAAVKVAAAYVDRARLARCLRDLADSIENGSVRPIEVPPLLLMAPRGEA